jgi:chorismate synthase
MTTAGESHGPAEVCVLSGVPAGLSLTTEAIDLELARRQGGYGRGGRMSIETDRCRFLAGVRHGMSLGTPIAILVENRDHVNWLEAMSAAPPSEGAAAPVPLSIPRPGHADLTGLAKYDHEDVRNVLERASARETVGRVAGGAVCKRLLEDLGVTVRARVTSIGAVTAPACANLSDPSTVEWAAVDASPVGCDDPEVSVRMCQAIDQARAAGESLGGIFEVWCWGLVPGVGGYSAAEDRLDGRLLGALGAIPAIKGAEIGYGFVQAALPGSQVHDPFEVLVDGVARWVGRTGNNAGGLEGGMTTGMPVVVRAGMKPIPTLTTPLPSVDLRSMEAVDAHVERSDVCAVPAARVVGEAVVAHVVASAYLEKFGGDCMRDLLGAVAAYEQRLGDRGLWRRR